MGTIWTHITDIGQVLILASVVYYVLTFFRGTRGFQTLVGGATALLSLLLIIAVLNMDELGWILKSFVPVMPVVIVVLFQPELRRIFAGIGEHTTGTSQISFKTIDEIIKSVDSLSHQRIGALIAIERTTSLKQHQQHGRVLDAPVVSELLSTIFYPHTPMHDGGVIIRDGLIAAAGCVFPIATGEGARRPYGTRHRAAIGLSENSDALVIVVSEETGTISLADHGELTRGYELDKLRKKLLTSLTPPETSSTKKRAIGVLSRKQQKQFPKSDISNPVEVAE